MVKVGIIGVSNHSVPQIEHLASNGQIHYIGYTSFREKLIKSENVALGSKMSLQELIVASDALVWIDPKVNVQAICDLLMQGKPVFIFYIAGFSPSDLEQLANVSREANVQCMLNLGARFNPSIQLIKQDSVQPLFIETNREWIFDSKAETTENIINFMLDDLSLIKSLVQSELKRVAATTITVTGEVADIANARLEFANGCVANLTINRIGMLNHHNVKVFLPEYYFLCNLQDLKLDKVYFRPHTTTVRSDYVAAISEGRDGMLAMEHIPLATNDGASNFAFQFFLESIRCKEIDLSGIYDAKWVLETALKLTKKINSLGEE